MAAPSETTLPADPTPAPAPLQAAAAAPPPPRPLVHRLVNLGWGTLGAAPLLAAAVLLTPSANGVGTHKQLGLPDCTFLWLSGFPCPFCGMTTSWTHAAHGELFAAVRTQPMGFVLFLVDALLVVWLLGRALTGGVGFRPERLLSAIPAPVWWGSLALTIASWIYKIAAVRGWI